MGRNDIAMIELRRRERYTNSGLPRREGRKPVGAGLFDSRSADRARRNLGGSLLGQPASVEPMKGRGLRLMQMAAGFRGVQPRPAAGINQRTYRESELGSGDQRECRKIRLSH